MKAKRLIFLFTCSLFLAGCELPFIAQKGGIQVAANPQAEVFLDSKSLGQTPVYQEGLKAGTYDLKIAPKEAGYVAWEGKVMITGNAATVVDRTLSTDASKSRGYTLSFEKLSDKTATEVSLVSFPDMVSITVDGAPAGFTPLKSDSIASGAHTFTLTSAGYQEQVIKATVTPGYRLVISAQLGVQTIVPTITPEATPSVSPTPTPSVVSEITPLPKQATDSAIVKPYVQINAANPGWVRVRAEASVSSAELAKVNHLDKFPYISSSGGWYQIEYLAGKKGFVSSSYATLVQ